jgi:group I intron endonuclease
MKKESLCGIYKITNTVNKKYYIGSAVNIKNRFKIHKRLLKQNKHFNSHLQTSYNKYGALNFIYDVIEITIKENLIEREQYWINLLNANNNKIGYNKRIVATSNIGIKFSNESIKKLSISHMGHKRSYDAQIKISASQYKKVCQFEEIIIKNIYGKEYKILSFFR